MCNLLHGFLISSLLEISDQTTSVRSSVFLQSHLTLKGFGYCLSLPPDAARVNGRAAAEKTNSFEQFVTLFKLQIVKEFLNTATEKIYKCIYMYILYI